MPAEGADRKGRPHDAHMFCHAPIDQVDEVAVVAVVPWYLGHLINKQEDVACSRPLLVRFRTDGFVVEASKEVGQAETRCI